MTTDSNPYTPPGLGAYRCSSPRCWCGGAGAPDTGEPAQLYIQIERVGAATVLVLEGELCASTLPDLQKWIDGAIEHGTRHLVVSLAEVGFIDFEGVGALLRTRRFLRLSGGDVVLAEPSLAVLRALDAKGVGGVLLAADTVAAALERPGRPAGGA